MVVSIVGNVAVVIGAIGSHKDVCVIFSWNKLRVVILEDYGWSNLLVIIFVEVVLN